MSFVRHVDIGKSDWKLILNRRSISILRDIE